MDADKNILDDEYMMALFYLYLQEQTSTRKLLNKLESDLRLSNRFFPESKLCDAIKNLSKVSLCTLKKGSTLYRCRLISKEDENLLFSKITTEWFSLAQAVVPTFDVSGGDEEWIKFCLYVKNHPEALSLWQERRVQLLEKYSKISFWGYDEKGSDAPPKGTASPGRINPDGISYLYAANDIQTAVLEVRPVPTQFVSVAQVELLEDVTIYSFIKPSSLETDKSNPFDWVDYDEISRYFGQPNYGGKSYYLATQYISEYIKHLKDSNHQTIFDGLCFRSSLNPSGTNYVLFDVSQSKKYRICNSSILAAVGEPLTLFTFDNAVLNRLEQEGWQIKRAPLSEYLWTLGPWKSIQHSAERMEAIGRLLRQRSSFSRNVQLLCANSERLLTGFAGANGRYRLAKAVELGLQTSGLLVVAPRYENAATVMEMTGALQNIPHFSLSVDGDWDETSRSRLESFLYYL